MKINNIIITIYTDPRSFRAVRMTLLQRTAQVPVYARSVARVSRKSLRFQMELIDFWPTITDRYKISNLTYMHSSIFVQHISTPIRLRIIIRQSKASSRQNIMLYYYVCIIFFLDFNEINVIQLHIMYQNKTRA